MNRTAKEVSSAVTCLVHSVQTAAFWALSVFAAAPNRGYPLGMPKWGLNSAMRLERPYGLPRHLLEPAKVITDPVEGDIRLSELERLIVDSPPFQRLRRIKQLGSTHEVYPGATHTRFSHSLGAVVAAQMLLDIVIEQRDEPNAKPDIFGEWAEVEAKGGPSSLRRTAEAIVLTRLGALLHDLCHMPFGHSVEDELRLLTPHDENLERFEALWDQIDPVARDAIGAGRSMTGRSLYDDLLPIILSALFKGPRGGEGDDPGVADISYPFAQDIVGNTISADLMDYLTRDHVFTGLPSALGHRFLDSFYVSPAADPFKPQRMVVRVVRRERERKDTLTELLKYLRYRYELSERALAHHAKLAADAMVGKVLQLYSDALWVDELEALAGKDEKLRTKIDDIDTGELDTLRSAARKHLSKGQFDGLTARTTESLEQTLRRRGDDGLLEYLRDAGEARDEDSRWAGIRDLATALLDRKLFKPVARMSDRSHAKRLWETYGQDPNERRQVEQAAAGFAGVKPAWHVVMWIPPERMRLKPALVLVDDDQLIDTLYNREVSPRGHERGKEIYEAHRDLWALEVFVHPSVRDDQVKCDALLAALAEQLHVTAWDDDHLPVKVAKVARRRAGALLELTRDQEQELKTLVPAFYEGSNDLGRGATLERMVDDYRLAWEAGHVKQTDEAPLDAGPDDAQQRLT